MPQSKQNDRVPENLNDFSDMSLAAYRRYFVEAKRDYNKACRARFNSNRFHIILSITSMFVAMFMLYDFIGDESRSLIATVFAIATPFVFPWAVLQWYKQTCSLQKKTPALTVPKTFLLPYRSYPLKSVLPLTWRSLFLLRQLY